MINFKFNCSHVPNIHLHGITPNIDDFHTSIEGHIDSLRKITHLYRKIRVKKKAATGNISHDDFLIIDICESANHRPKTRELEGLGRLISIQVGL